MLRKSILISAVFLLALFGSQSYGQDGPININIKLLESILQKADTHVMLKQINGSVYALDSKRNTIYPAGYVAPKDEVFYVFEANYLKGLLGKKSFSKSANDTIIVQTYTIPPCPPQCP